MSTIELRSIELYNFLSHENSKLDFLSGRHLVVGNNLSSKTENDNGSGKSSIFEALYWVIYGVCLKGDPSRDFKGNCSVKLNLKINSEDFLFERYYKHKEKGTTILVYKNGDDISGRNPSTTNKIILDLFGISYEMFISTIAIAQGKPINFSKMTPTIRKTIFEEMLDINVWDSIQKRIREESSLINVKLQEFSTKFLAKKDEMIKLSSKIDTIKNIVIEDTSNSDQEIRELKDKSRSVIEKREGLLSELSKSIDPTKENPQSKFSKVSQPLRSNISVLRSKLTDLNQIINERVCPTCQREYPTERLNEAKLNAEKVSFEIQQGEEELQVLVEQFNKLDNLYSDYSSLVRELDNYTVLLKNLVNKKPTVSVNKNTQELQDQLAVLVDEVNVLNTEIEYHKKEIEAIEYLMGLLKPSSKFRSFLLEKFLVNLNIVLNSISSSILDGVKISIELENRHNGIVIKTERGGVIRDIESYSGGEGSKIDLILILAMQRYRLEFSNIKININILDELFDYLDSDSVREILESVDLLFGDVSCIYVISHNKEIKGLFDSIYTVTKENGVSRLEKE